MELDNDFYKRIVYKKNAFEDLSLDLRAYYPYKNVLLISTKSLSGKHLTDIINAVSMAKCTFKHFISKNNFSAIELKEISDKLIKENFDIIIVFGAGRATDVAKYFAYIFNVPYLSCPSAPSSVAYFSNLCVNPYDSTRSFIADVPERIYIQESVIKKAPKQLVKRGICFVLGFYEQLVCVNIENILFDKNTDVNEIKKVINKVENELTNLLTGNDDSKLVLLDALIDLSFCTREMDYFKNSCFNLCFIISKLAGENGEMVGGGEAFVLASKMLLTSYLQMFSNKKIEILELPDFVKIEKSIKLKNVFVKRVNNLNHFKKIFKNKSQIQRINNLKEEFYFQCQKRIENLNSSLSKINLYTTILNNKTISADICLTAVSLLPYITENNYIVNVLGGMGVLNF